jgi:hypothetical protein
MNIIKQYGLERTGTNYIKALLDVNCKDTRVLSNMFGLKHEKFKLPNLNTYNPRIDKNVITDLSNKEIEEIREKFIKEEIFYLVTIKNPYSWVVSYNNCNWINVNHGKLNKNKIIKYIKRWNEVNGDWVESLIKGKSDNTFGFIYEDLIYDPKKIVKEIANKFNIELSKNFKNIEKNMHPGTDVHGSKNISNSQFNKKEYYLNQNYKKEIPKDLIELIEENMDNNILKSFKRWSTVIL